ncbi:MAG: nitroreductase family protein [Treponema sp.]|jgi:nitroreductase|nr:nitroreductase family protein [Treponema sp.]
MEQELLEIIKRRRSTRAFEDRPVPRAALEKLLEAAIWAPSGSNSQSWLFTAILNRQVIDRINALIRQGFQTWIPDDDYPAKQGAKKSSGREDFHFCNHAPALIIASNRPNYENAMADCSLALENIFLLAESMGLGSCYINSPHWLRDDGPLRDYLFTLGIPREHTICSSAAIGYIAKPSVPPARREGVCNIIE